MGNTHCSNGHEYSVVGFYQRTKNCKRCLQCQRIHKKDWRIKVGMKPHGKPSERFWEKVKKTDTCWLWTANMNNKGYGHFDLFGKNIVAHRFSYIENKGPIPQGLVIDHLCRVKNCVNPDHLEAVTNSVNIRRGRSCNKHLTCSLPKI